MEPEEKKSSRSSGIMRFFSVMQRRDDLPQMPLPLAILLMLLVSGISAASAKAASAEGAVEIGIAFLLLPSAICMYALIILLWRRVASLAATPLSTAAMLLCGADTFYVISLSLAILFAAYVFAVSMIERESRFRRVSTLAATVGICVVLGITARISLDYSSAEEFFEAFKSSAALSASALYKKAGVNAAPETFRDFAKELLVLSPAYIGFLSMVFARLTDFLTAKSFVILGCTGVFTKDGNHLTLPIGFAAIYAVVLFLTLSTSKNENPMIYAMLKNMTIVMILPCASVGLSRTMHALEEKMYFMTRERTLAIIILVILFVVLGISSFLVIASAIGAVFAIKEYIASKIGHESN